MASRRRSAWVAFAITAVAVVATSFVLAMRGENDVVAPRNGAQRTSSDERAQAPPSPVNATISARSSGIGPSASRDSAPIGQDAPAPRSPLDPPIVRFKVFDPTGAPAKRATFQAFRGRSTNGQAEFEKDLTSGELPLPLDGWTLRAVATSDSFPSSETASATVHDLLSEEVVVDVRLGDAPRDVALHLVSHPAIYGVVHGSTGDSSCSVFCWRVRDGVEIDEKQLSPRHPCWRTSVIADSSEQDGPYVIEGLDPGRYALAAGSYAIGAGSMLRSSPPRVVNLTERSLRVDLTAPIGPQPGDLFVRVHGPGGAQPGRLDFGLAPSPNESFSRTISNAPPEADGR
jgi:hypothetical protein